MQVVILAAGAGNRVKPLSTNKSKVMIEIMGKPLLQYVVETLATAGLKNMIIVVGQNGEQIKSFFGDGRKFGVSMQYVYQKEARGMADAVQAAEHLVSDNFFVINADDIFEAELIESMLQDFKRGGADILLSCKPVKETWKFGILAMDKDNNVTRIVEKPLQGQEPSTLAVVGVYLLTKKIFDYYRQLPISDQQYEDAIQAFINAGGKVRAVSYDGSFCSFKYPWDLFAINKHLMDKFLTERKISATAKISDKAIIGGNVFIGDNVKILEGAVVKGPCYIGSGSIIGTNALIRDYSSVGSNCVIGFSSEVKHSIIGDNCWFHTNYIGDSIISDNCKFGAGSVTANFRFDEKNVLVKIKDERIDTGSSKFGAIVADNCKIGVNSTLLPGVKLGPNSIVGPGICLAEDLDPNKAIFLDKKSYIIKENKIQQGY